MGVFKNCRFAEYTEYVTTVNEFEGGLGWKIKGDTLLGRRRQLCLRH